MSSDFVIIDPWASLDILMSARTAAFADRCECL
jgi:hypothetical protein